MTHTSISYIVESVEAFLNRVCSLIDNKFVTFLSAEESDNFLKQVLLLTANFVFVDIVIKMIINLTVGVFLVIVIKILFF